MNSLTKAIEHRLALLTITSAYRLEGDDALHRIADIMPSQATNPWFWPGVDSIVMCPVDPTDVVQPTPRPPLTPERTGSPIADVSTWSTIWETLEDGRRMIVGRYPSFSQLWGNVIDRFPDVIPLQSFDAFQGALASGAPYREASRLLLPGHATTPPTGPGLLMPKVGIIGPPVLPGEERYVDEHGRRPRQIRPPDGQNCWERISCIGLDIDRKAVTATISILQSSGYGGSLCDSNSFESVGFWLIEPSHAELEPQDWPQSPRPNRNSGTPLDPCGGSVRFLGSTSVKVVDIARADQTSVVCANPALRYNAKPLHYTVSLDLRDEDLDLMRFCSEDPRLPALHCVLRWNVNVRNYDYGGRLVSFGDSRTSVVQYPTSQALRPNDVEQGAGLQHGNCKSALLSSLIRIGIDQVGINVTPEIFRRARLSAAMFFMLVPADSTRPPSDWSATSPGVFVGKEYDTGTLNEHDVLTPFEANEVQFGNYYCCLIFQSSSRDARWQRGRDIVITGLTNEQFLTFIGDTTSFAAQDVVVSGPEILPVAAFQYRHERDSTKISNYPPCIPDLNIESRFRRSSAVELHVFYPRNLTTAERIEERAHVLPVDSVVFLVPANGTFIAPNLGGHPDWDYQTLIRTLVLQGFVVAAVKNKDLGSSYFFLDGLDAMLDTLRGVIPKVDELDCYFIGHSQGGSQVARVVGDSALHDLLGDRLKGSILIAPAYWQGMIPRAHTPLLTFSGALDSQNNFVMYECADRTFDTYIYSDRIYFDRTSAPFNSLILVDGATHMRWIDAFHARDDIGSVDFALDPSSLESKLVLDGPEIKQQGQPFTEHFSIILSYATYFFQAIARGNANLAEPFIITSFIPPDILELERFSFVNDQVHVYSTLQDRMSFNSKGSADVYPFMSTMIVRRVSGSDRYRGAVAGLCDEKTFPLFNDDVVAASGSAVSVEFAFQPGYHATSHDILTLRYVVLSPTRTLYDGKVKLEITMTLLDGSIGTLALDSLAVLTRDIRLTHNITTQVGRKGVSGHFSTMDDASVPLSWVFADCSGGDVVADGSFHIAAVKITCSSVDGSAITFGMGDVCFVRSSEVANALSS